MRPLFLAVCLAGCVAGEAKDFEIGHAGPWTAYRFEDAMSGKVHCAAHYRGLTLTARTDHLLFDVRRYALATVQYRYGEAPAEPEVPASDVQREVGLLTIEDDEFQRALDTGRLRIRITTAEPELGVAFPYTERFDFDLDMASLRTLLPALEKCGP